MILIKVLTILGLVAIPAVGECARWCIRIGRLFVTDCSSCPGASFSLFPSSTKGDVAKPTPHRARVLGETCELENGAIADEAGAAAAISFGAKNEPTCSQNVLEAETNELIEQIYKELPGLERINNHTTMETVVCPGSENDGHRQLERRWHIVFDYAWFLRWLYLDFGCRLCVHPDDIRHLRANENRRAAEFEDCGCQMTAPATPTHTFSKPASLSNVVLSDSASLEIITADGEHAMISGVSGALDLTVEDVVQINVLGDAVIDELRFCLPKCQGTQDMFEDRMTAIEQAITGIVEKKVPSLPCLAAAEPFVVVETSAPASSMVCAN